MIFPDTPRVIYKNNPLVEVLCQLRFPSILLIDSQPPAAFQEKIRQDYPLFNENQITEFKLDIPPEVVELSKGAVPSTFRTGKAAYDFISQDQQWKVGLTRDFLALSTVQYERWEGFKNHLQGPLDAFIEAYSPTFFSRIGLRYRDVIQRSRFNLENVPWKELLEPHIAGELNTEAASAISGVVKQIQLKLPDNGGDILIQHGLIQLQNEETGYIIDSDFSISDQTEVGDALEKLDTFNQESRRLFRWCITDPLHNAMAPQPI